MSHEEETECGTASFRCVDPIQNFKIRVVLKPVKMRFIPVPAIDVETNPSTSESPNQNEEPESDIEEYVFSWQEKVFSKSEIEKYSNLSNCKTKLHEKYHEDVTSIMQKSKNHRKKLFSYVDVDNYKLKDEHINAVDRGNGFISTLAKQIDNMEISGSTVRNYKNISKYKIVNYTPNNDFKKQNHLINTSSQKMFLMADLGLRDNEDVKSSDANNEEYVLCVIVYDPVSRVVKMTPSFSKQANTKPYCVGTNGQYSRSAYHYWLHHASLQPSEEDIANEKRIRNRIVQHQMEIRKLQIGNEFRVQPPNYISVTILGEIISGRDFEYDRLSVHYVTHLPTGWHSPHPESLIGMTHTSRSNDNGVSHFCQLFTIELMFDIKHLEDFSAYLPQIFFEVLSTDRWNIHRNEGYGFITLPRTPGIHNYTLRCWRGLDNSVRAELDRFFLGGSQILEDITYAGMGAKNDKKRVMSRFSFTTIPTGSLDVRLNIIHQSEAFKSEKEKRTDADRNIFGRFETSNLMGNVNAVLEAFRQARERMLKAKETLEADAE